MKVQESSEENQCVKKSDLEAAQQSLDSFNNECFSFKLLLVFRYMIKPAPAVRLKCCRGIQVLGPNLAQLDLAQLSLGETITVEMHKVERRRILCPDK